MDRVRLGKTNKDKVINPALHSQFIEFLGSCISDGIWVGKNSDIPNYDGMRKDVVDALAKIHPPVVRWPGGCYADMYHWRDGVGPVRKETWNENFTTWKLEKNEFGTHEFMDFCRRIGAKPWININMLRGTVGEMVEWAEYCNRTEGSLAKERAANGSPEPFNVDLWGIGNEAWAGGGNYTAQSYAAEYRKYASAMPRFSKLSLSGAEKGPNPRLIASGPDGNKPKERVKWTRDFFKALGEYRVPPINGYDLHFYNWNLKDMQKPETEFSTDDWYRVIAGAFELEDVIHEQDHLMKEGMANLPEAEGDLPSAKPDIKLVVGEWGNWHGASFFNEPSLYQQCTMRDAITTALTLDIFHRNSDIVAMACAAQTVNVLNSLILTEGDKTILTPNYDVFEMYMPHRGGKPVDLEIRSEEAYDNGQFSVKSMYSFASEKNDIYTVNLINPSEDEQDDVTIELPVEGNIISAKVLESDDVHAVNTAEDPNRIRVKNAENPKRLDGRTFQATLPKASVSVYQFRISQRES